MRELKADLKQLVETPGVSGFEKEVRELIAGKLQDTVDSLREDAFGNLIAECGKNAGYKIGVYAHMDEVGMIVNKISARGLLSFDFMGMIDERILPGSHVLVCTGDGRQIPGVIGNKSKHLQTAQDMDKTMSYKEMSIDVGCSSKEEVEQLGIQVGCQVTFATRCTFYDNGVVLAKSLDDRIGCLVLMKTMEELKDKLNNVTLYGLFTVQEEIGARGAASVASGMGLDMFITLDTAPVQNGNDIKEGDINLGNGPVIRISDMMAQFTKGMITNPQILERMIEVAKEHNIPYQADVLHSTYLDSCTAQFTDNGLPGGSICFPRRYSHTAVEMSNLYDIDQAVTLLSQVILSLDKEPIRFGKKYK
ncbi:MAG: M42 family metallopeptidase [Eubacteriales bacterium]|nr:M42 family metallopeptidase [Eubacteriales bacterium]